MQESSPEARNRLIAAMDRLAAGDRDALEVVYRLTNVKLFGICLRILHDRKEAEDALQDVYITLWRNAARYDAKRASPIAWLATFARNRAIDRLRTGKVRRGAVPVETANELPDGTPASIISTSRSAAQSAPPSSMDILTRSWRNAATYRWAR